MSSSQKRLELRLKYHLELKTKLRGRSGGGQLCGEVARKIEVNKS